MFQLLKGATDKQLSKLKLTRNPHDYAYLCQGRNTKQTFSPKVMHFIILLLLTEVSSNIFVICFHPLCYSEEYASSRIFLCHKNHVGIWKKWFLLFPKILLASFEKVSCRFCFCFAFEDDSKLSVHLEITYNKYWVHNVNHFIADKRVSRREQRLPVVGV